MHVFFRYQFFTSNSKTQGHLSQKTIRSLILPLLITTTSLLSACGGGGGGSSAGIDSNTGRIGTADQTTITNTNTSGTATTATNTTVIANPDSTSTQKDVAVNIPVLVNDSGVTSSTVITIEGAPGNGRANILANNTIRYIPDSDFSGKDSFSYQIANGASIAVTTVTVNVKCTTCTDKTIALSWNPSISGSVSDSGYLIFYGDAKGNIKTLAFDLSTATGLDPDAPYIEFSSKNDLQLNPGDSVCFKIKAYAASVVSAKSTAACGVI
jgi:hypothetical protein